MAANQHAVANPLAHVAVLLSQAVLLLADVVLLDATVVVRLLLAAVAKLLLAVANLVAADCWASCSVAVAKPSQLADASRLDVLRAHADVLLSLPVLHLADVALLDATVVVPLHLAVAVMQVQAVVARRAVV